MDSQLATEGDTKKVSKETSSTKTPKFYLVEGFLLDETYTEEALRSAIEFVPRPNDVIIATYPKSGTTWMCQIVLLILRRGKTFANADEYFKSCPYIDFEGAEAVDNMLKPGCIKTHLPFDRITFSDKAKYIYVARHPRDVVVSAYHQTKYFPTYYFSDGTFDDFFELFIRGVIDYNDYFDHLLSWYEHRNDPNVFFITYESMKANHRGCILDVAKFLGYGDFLEENPNILDDIVYYSSFDYMKRVTNNMFTDYYLNPKDAEKSKEKQSFASLEKATEEGHESSGVFIRNGKVGEGKAVLSEEQEKKLQDRIAKKTKGSDVMSLWNE